MNPIEHKPNIQDTTRDVFVYLDHDPRHFSHMNPVDDCRDHSSGLNHIDTDTCCRDIDLGLSDRFGRLLEHEIPSFYHTACVAHALCLGPLDDHLPCSVGSLRRRQIETRNRA